MQESPCFSRGENVKLVSVQALMSIAFLLTASTMAMFRLKRRGLTKFTIMTYLCKIAENLAGVYVLVKLAVSYLQAIQYHLTSNEFITLAAQDKSCRLQKKENTMSTELVAIERITICKGDSNADDIRSCLAHYLLQFINSASIESLSMHKLSIKVDGKTVLFVQDKTGGVGLKGLDTDWQHTPEMSAILDQLVTDVDVEVFLSYEMIHYFSTENFYGYNFWSEVLQEYGCEAVRYKGLEYYDVESNVVMLSFDGKQLCDNPDYVPESAVKDIHKWFCYTFEMSLEPDTPFNAAQVDKMFAAIESVHGVFGREEDDVADVGEDYLSICTGVTLTDKEVPAFAAFLQAMSDVAKELDTTLDYTAEFTPAEMETFAAMIMDNDKGKIVPRYYRY